jgi:hypothetical protein
LISSRCLLLFSLNLFSCFCAFTSCLSILS